MAVLPLWFDVVNRRLVVSATNPDPWLLPTLYQEDVYEIEFGALRPTGLPTNPYFSRVNLAGHSLAISIGSAATVHASATTWTPSSDSLLLSGSLSLNTAGIAALADGAQVIFEVKLTSATGPIRSQSTVQVRKAVNVAGSLVPVAGDTALGFLEADRLYVRKEGRPGEGFILRSEDGTQMAYIQLTNTGTLEASPLS